MRPEDVRWSQPEHLFDEMLRVCAFAGLFFGWTFLFITGVDDVQLARILIVADLIVASSIAMAAHLVFCKHTFLADIPKGSWHMHVLLLLPLLVSPLNWIVLIVSRIKMNRMKRRLASQELYTLEPARLNQSVLSIEALRESVQHVVDQREAIRENPEYRSRNRPVVTETKVKRENRTDVSSLPSYRSSPNAGEAAYVNAIEAYSIGNVRQKRDKLEKELEEVRELISKSQKKMNETRAAISELDEVLEKYKETSQERHVEQQFHKLMELSSVVAVEVVNHKLRLIVRCEAVVDGKTYDLGDWRISIKPGSSKLKTKLLRDGRRPDWDDYSDPPHINDDDTFCFGGNEEELQDLLKRGQLFAAITCAIRCMCTTLPGREQQIPLVFKELQR